MCVSRINWCAINARRNINRRAPPPRTQTRRPAGLEHGLGVLESPVSTVTSVAPQVQEWEHRCGRSQNRSGNTVAEPQAASCGSFRQSPTAGGKGARSQDRPCKVGTLVVNRVRGGEGAEVGGEGGSPPGRW